MPIDGNFPDTPRHSWDVTPNLEAVAARAATGDGEAFEVLCRSLNDEVWRYCRALTGDDDLAFEAAQETFVRLVPAIRRFRADSPVRPFVLTIARRCVAACLRSTAKHRAAPLSSAPEPAAPDHARSVEAALLVSELPEDLRDAFVLTQLLGLPYEQAASVCGCPVGTIRSRVYRARERLIDVLHGAADTPLAQEASDD